MPGQTDGVGAGSGPGAMTHRSPCQEKPLTVCGSDLLGARSSDGQGEEQVHTPDDLPRPSLEASRQSSSGVGELAHGRVARRLNAVVPVAGCPAVDNSRVSPVMTDHDCMSGPPVAAQARITSWARGTDNDSRAARSSAISWASAPSRVRGNPVGTPAGPMLVADGRVITPAVPWLRVPGSASLSVSSLTLSSGPSPASSGLGVSSWWAVSPGYLAV